MTKPNRDTLAKALCATYFPEYTSGSVWELDHFREKAYRDADALLADADLWQPAPEADRDAMHAAAMKVLHPEATRNFPLANDYAYRIVDAILASGFRPPPRTVSAEASNGIRVERREDGGLNIGGDWLDPKSAVAVREFVILEEQHPGNCENCGHRSDCALHNGPALPVGACDCRPVSPHTVSTVEELDALPVGSVILGADGDVCRLDRITTGGKPRDRWHSINWDGIQTSADVALPATVLFVPSEGVES